MDNLVNLIAIVSLTGVAVGQALIGLGFPILLLIGILDGQKGGRLSGEE
ncbi:MAG TPA: hypothetical protein PKA64_02420 [Myxococcota bacterium]|nr:hypothetical protein [Myxococcota bacterium]